MGGGKEFRNLINSGAEIDLGSTVTFYPSKTTATTGAEV
jgi:hypothetical protein